MEVIRELKILAVLIDLEVLKQGDVLKVDIGVHVKGRILDSAFTMIWEPTYEKLVEAVKAATNTGVRVGGNHTQFWPSLLTLFLGSGD